ncbi:MAG: hypothetical protein ACPGWR_16625 [Ardenticatenaceae bacterium]
MKTIEVTLAVSDHVAQSLANGTYERVGGIVRESRSKQIVTWLREVGHEVNSIENNNNHNNNNDSSY